MTALLIEDHLLVRDLLRRACAAAGCEVVGEADDVRTAARRIAELDPGLIVLDLHLPGGDGLDLLDDARRSGPARRILIVSSRCDPYAVYRMERAGVSGVVDKSSHSLAMLEHALRVVAGGKPYWSPAFLAQRAARRGDPLAFDKVLSEREQAVLIGLGRGNTDAETARRLGIARATVEKHRFNAQRKLGLGSTAELQRYARVQGFGAPAPAGA